jgi:molybdenum cofactor synthesis domain-containing protein
MPMGKKRQTYRNLKSLGEARNIFFARFKDYRTEAELVPVRQAAGRFLVEAVKAARSVPAHHSAAMDGVAVRATTTFGALPERPVSLKKGVEAIEINTGNPLPEGTDAVVMIENVEYAGDRCEIRDAAYPWQNIRKTGEDIVRGEILLPAHHQIRSYDQGALLAAGVLSIHSFQKPRVLILPTGNEILEPEDAEDPLPPGRVLEVNGQVLSVMVAECGGEAVIGTTVPDDPGAIREAVAAALKAGYHIVLIIAGSSAGTEDYAPSLLAEMGELLVHGVTVMPGKPTLLAAVDGKPVIGIPGYPVSAVIAFREFVRPLLYRMQGVLAPEPETIAAVAGRKIPSRPGLEEHVRVVLGEVNERIVAIPLSAGAGMMTSLVRADGILRIEPEVSGYSEGERVAVELLTPARALKGRLLAIGSHDLTIDLLASMIKEESAGEITISSSNVGSLGGLLAIEKGIAHFAGSHLLDTETGEYNRSYVERYLSEIPVTLLTLVHRHQGFIIRRGNPKGIRQVSDLAKSGVVMVNRQPGSGTRVLLDYELQKAGVKPGSILGYRNEEFTHMSVAMAVASGRADVGMGILAAAKALDLDFIPVGRERYDLVIPTSLLNDRRILLLLKIIRSSRFAAQALAMGGYEVEETGRIVR